MIKKNGRLQFKNAVDLSMFQKLTAQLKEGAVIEQMTSFNHEDGILSQLSKVHAMIKDIAKETGNTVSATKVEIKKQCGLVTMGGDVKSFGDASFEELSDCIQHCIEVGQFLGINLS